MSYIIAMRTLSRWKARNRIIYPTKAEALQTLQMLNLAQARASGAPIVYRVVDADSDEGRALLKACPP